MNAHPDTKRTYRLRSYLRCDLCSHRTWGNVVRRKTGPDDTYYRCTPNRLNHSHLSWFATHPPNVVVREDQLLDPLAHFFNDRVFGASRKELVAAPDQEMSVGAELAAKKNAVVAAVMDARRRQDQYLKELGNLVPTGDPDVDNAWRSGIQREFASAVAEQKAKKSVLDRIVREAQSAAPVDVHLLDLLRMEEVDLLRLDEDHQRRVFDAFHLEMQFNALDRTLKIRVTITGDTAPTLAAAVAAIVRTPVDSDEGRGSELVLGPAAYAVGMHGVPPEGVALRGKTSVSRESTED